MKSLSTKGIQAHLGPASIYCYPPLEQGQLTLLWEDGTYTNKEGVRGTWVFLWQADKIWRKRPLDLVSLNIKLGFLTSQLTSYRLRRNTLKSQIQEGTSWPEVNGIFHKTSFGATFDGPPPSTVQVLTHLAEGDGEIKLQIYNLSKRIELVLKLVDFYSRMAHVMTQFRERTQ